MGIFRGDGGTGDSTTDTTVTTVTQKAAEAASSATSAANSATAAATSASNAATSESNAATSASNASTSESNAATSAASAASSYDNFDDRYLGAKSSAPTVDNDGDALITGALYFDTTANNLYMWTGSSWKLASSNVDVIASRATFTVGTSSGSYTGSLTTFPVDYDVGQVDVFLNGIKLLNGTDFTATSGTTVVLTSNAATNDVINLIGYTLFSVAVGSINGIIKADGSGNLSVAVADTDYATITTATTSANGLMSSSDKTKLDGIATSATANPNAIDNLVEDTTPQLGGTLDANSNTIDMGTNTITDTKVGQWDESYARPAPTMQVFTANGTWTAPSGCRSVEVTVVGGGGGGGGVDGIASYGAAGGGGGGAGTAIKIITSSTFGATETVTIGSGGSGGAGSGGGNGSTGGDSSFGSHCTGGGGFGGTGRQATSSTFTNATFANGGSGGMGSNGDINLRGGPGGKGSAAGTSTNETNGGVGGNSFLAGGPQGIGGDNAGRDAYTGGYGAGGSGASVNDTSSNYAGGDGGDGIVIVREYY